MAPLTLQHLQNIGLEPVSKPVTTLSFHGEDKCTPSSSSSTAAVGGKFTTGAQIRKAFIEFFEKKEGASVRSILSSGAAQRPHAVVHQRWHEPIQAYLRGTDRPWSPARQAETCCKLPEVHSRRRQAQRS